MTSYLYLLVNWKSLKIDISGINQCHEGSISGSSADKLCFHKRSRKYGSRGPLNKHVHAFLPIVNYSHFILSYYREVGQKPAQRAMLKNLLEDKTKMIAVAQNKNEICKITGCKQEKCPVKSVFRDHLY